ncbi:MAG: hypothetical protein IPP25_08050 [Saprospiraceae bacterium]|nr:hypothetical protein [Candidatus Opimibacter skivensis]
MSQNQYSDDLAHIRSMMERSSRFLSLSGWAGIIPGLLALAGLAAAAWLIKASKLTNGDTKSTKTTRSYCSSPL